jgi:hypothetical protein
MCTTNIAKTFWQLFTAISVQNKIFQHIAKLFVCRKTKRFKDSKLSSKAQQTQSSAYEFLLMEIAEFFKHFICYVKQHEGLILLKLKFIGINKLTDLYLS